MPSNPILTDKAWTMSSQKTTVGDIVLIPITEGFRPAKVLYVSQRYKDTILLGLYATCVSAQQLPEPLADTFALLLYTSRAPVQKQRWPRVGHEALRESQTRLDLRVVAGELWQGDEHLGVASAEQRKILPEMLVMGAGLVEKKAAALS
ncbi:MULTISPECIES: hypothetical protein [unclassified Pseudomonas]|uniref:hypothetical protein n=1 Tax=unclassified Pseudomonas TaxID=196821 RepID=UPI0011B69C54|nr:MULTISPECIES: hypothetical protein [unclassified Pseudomonas]